MIDIALFPIPECVSFPGTIFPLHVFEPRYRDMVNYCIEHEMPMAVCHTKKVLSPAKPNQKLKDALQSNQATYKPFPVFSAGRCELQETLDDGRMLINVYIDKRYEAVEARQVIPFGIYSCELYTDISLTAQQSKEAELLQQKILHRLLAMTAGDEIAQQILGAEEWQEKTVDTFSFELMALLQLDADFKQHILELRSPLERLSEVMILLNKT